MKKLKFIRKVARILLFATLFALLAGCTTPANPTSPTEPNPTTVTDPTTQTDPTEPTDAGLVLFDGSTEFIAVQFADISTLLIKL